MQALSLSQQVQTLIGNRQNKQQPRTPSTLGCSNNKNESTNTRVDELDRGCCGRIKRIPQLAPLPCPACPQGILNGPRFDSKNNRQLGCG
jgi:hypothetical protein